MPKVQSSNHKIVLICMNLVVMYFQLPHFAWCELSKHRNAPVSLACSVVYSAGLYLQVQERLHWLQIKNSLYNNPQQCRSHLLCGSSAKSCLISVVHGAHTSRVKECLNIMAACHVTGTQLVAK